MRPGRQGEVTRLAFPASDAKAWVRKQLELRRRYFLDTVVPLLRDAGLTTSAAGLARCQTLAAGHLPDRSRRLRNRPAGGTIARDERCRSIRGADREYGLMLDTAPLGSSGLRISRVGIGTAPLGSTPDWSIYWGPQDERAAVRGIQAALDGGVTWIDTAPYYGWGRAEELVGRAIRGRGPDALVFTKCGTLRGGEGGEHVDLTPAAIRRDLEASLRRLGRSHVDMLQLHDPDPNVSIEESWTEVQRLIAAGSVRYGGLSNHPLALVERATTIAPVAAVQYRYNLLSRDIERDALPYGRANGVGVLSWGSLAEGLLSDSFTVEELDAHDFRRARPNFREPRYSRIQRFVAELAGIAAAAGSTTAGVAIAWLLARPGLTGAIVGVRSESEGRALADAGQLRLPSAVFEQVDEALQRYERGER